MITRFSCQKLIRDHHLERFLAQNIKPCYRYLYPQILLEEV